MADKRFKKCGGWLGPTGLEVRCNRKVVKVLYDMKNHPYGRCHRCTKEGR